MAERPSTLVVTPKPPIESKLGQGSSGETNKEEKQPRLPENQGNMENEGDKSKDMSSSPKGPEAKAVYGGDIGYGAGAAVDLHTGSIVFSDKGTLSSDTYQWLLAEDERRSRRKRCPRFCYTGLCVAKCYSITLGLALVALIIAVVMTISSVPKIRGFQYVRGFRHGNCTTLEAAFEGNWEDCECKLKKSSFPCVQVYVSVNGYHTNETSSHLLRSTDFDLIEGLPCSFQPVCNCDKEVNRVKVIHFIKRYKHPGTSFSCFYNPARISEIILERTPDVTLEWLKVLLPSVIFSLCLVTLFLVWLLRKQKVWAVLKDQTEQNPQKEDESMEKW